MIHWHTQDGQVLRLDQMTDEHLQNAKRQSLKQKNYAACEAIWFEQELRKKVAEESATQLCPYCGGEMRITFYPVIEVGFSPDKKQFACQCGARGPYIQ